MGHHGHHQVGSIPIGLAKDRFGKQPRGWVTVACGWVAGGPATVQVHPMAWHVIRKAGGGGDMLQEGTEQRDSAASLVTRT